MEFPDPLPEIIADLAPSPTPDTDPGPTDVSTTELVSAQAPAPTCEIISDPALVLEAAKPQKKRPKFSTVTNKDKTVEIRGGKLIFHESKLNYQIHPSTIRELALFHEMKYSTQVQNAIQIEDQLRQFSPLIGKLVQESEKPLDELAIFIKEILCPTGFDDADPWNDILLPSMLEAVIQEVAVRRLYGVNVESPETGENHICDMLRVYRWDVSCIEGVFPKTLIPAILRRRQGREELQAEAQQLFNELPVEEKIWIASQTSSRKKRKLDAAVTGLLDEKDVACETKSPIIKTPIAKKEKTPRPVVKPAPVENKPAKPTVSIKGFFSSVKKGSREPTALVKEPAHTSDYSKYFHPFRVKHDTSLAEPRTSKIHLTLDFDKIINKGCVSKLSGSELLRQQQQTLGALRQLVLDGRKSDQNDDDVTAYAEEMYRPKLLHFHENYRPAFFGAWLNESTKISPRNFLKKDQDLLDYSFDSEEEWQEEEEGELLADSDEEDDEEDEDFDSKDGSDSENDVREFIFRV
ncbi:hypothetical protein DSO57_1028674 [Entomophthora muscae]|uniref:Uncharacterized protein n=1 Tax=Entomophthora muscae TaxID=34485 RepID=A0ACC2RSA6_9FUNG|nr:hypothetical protein DSO57_1028674 [Entomophthora muscae]